MKRHFYISNDPADLEAVEQELHDKGIAWAQVHVVSDNEAALEKRRLHRVVSIFKKDVLHGYKIGFFIGLPVALLVLGVAASIGMPKPYLWFPVILLSLLLLGFCTWEGGLIGIQKPNHHYKRFLKVLRHGKHVVVVDVAPEQVEALHEVMKKHPRVHFAGFGEEVPDWLVGVQQGI